MLENEIMGGKDTFEGIKTTNNRKYIKEYIWYIHKILDEKLMPKNRQAVLIGNIIEESGGDPFAKSKDNNYQGLLQWSKDRFTMPETNDPYKAINYEVNHILDTIKNTTDGKSWTHGGVGSGYNSYKDAYDLFWNDKSSLKDMHRAFSWGYVRPLGKEASSENRYKVVEQVYNMLNDEEDTSDEDDETKKINFFSNLLSSLREARDAKIGAVGAENVRQMFSNGENKDAKNLSRQILLGNALGISALKIPVFQKGGTVYKHNDYYGYINKINEQAIKNPKWFWSDDPKASEARQWLYNNGASSIVDNIFENTPDEIKKTINPKYLPKKSGDEYQTKRMIDSMNAAKDTVSKGLLPMLAAPFAVGTLAYSVPNIITPVITNPIVRGTLDTVGTAIGAVDLASENGIKKTIRFSKEGNVPRVILSGLGDTLNTIPIIDLGYNAIKIIPHVTKLAKALSVAKVVGKKNYNLINDLKNTDGSINWNGFDRFQKLFWKKVGTKENLNTRPENPKYHKNDPFTIDHIKNVVKSATLDSKNPKVIEAALFHDFTKPLHNELGIDHSVSGK